LKTKLALWSSNQQKVKNSSKFFYVLLFIFNFLVALKLSSVYMLLMIVRLLMQIQWLSMFSFLLFLSTNVPCLPCYYLQEPFLQKGKIRFSSLCLGLDKTRNIEKCLSVSPSVFTDIFLQETLRNVCLYFLLSSQTSSYKKHWEMFVCLSFCLHRHLPKRNIEKCWSVSLSVFGFEISFDILSYFSTQCCSP